MENVGEKLQDIKKRRTGLRREKTRRAVLKEVLAYFLKFKKSWFLKSQQKSILKKAYFGAG